MSMLLRTPAIRAIEQAALAAGERLMARAGLAAATVAREMLTAAPNQPARVLVLAGPGNNGGDAFEAACHLKAWGCAVLVCSATDPAQMPADASRAARQWHAAAGASTDSLPASAGFDLVIDGMFGIGLTRPLGPPYAAWVSVINAANVPVLALDLPSGLDADTGSLHGAAIRADRTITFIADKPGLHTRHGPDHAGRIAVATLELRPAQPSGADAGTLLQVSDFSACLTPRLRNSHKGTYGSVGIVGGAAGMAGAALLAGRAAQKLGAGRVLVGMLDPGIALDPLQPELMLQSALGVLDSRLNAAVVGPGLGQGDGAAGLVERAAALECPLVLDADALNLMAQNAKLAAAITRRRHGTLMTPHPLEAARLLGQSLDAVQRDRIAAALTLARLYHADVLLKGAGSVVAATDGRWWINPTGNPGMASGGMGDVLSGMVGACAAQDVPPLAALLCATYLHGAAADSLLADGIGPVGLTAGETIDRARLLRNRWTTS